MTEDQIKHMVNRFLGWKLPKPFHPDNFITFTPPAPLNPGTPYENDLWPIGTNLFNADQAEAMIRHMLDLPTEPTPDPDLVLAREAAERAYPKGYSSDRDREKCEAAILRALKLKGQAHDQ